MQTIWTKSLRSHLLRASLAVLFYIALSILLQATAPAAANWGAEKNLIGWTAVLFALTMTLLGYTRRAWISFFAFLALYLSVAFLETKAGMNVNGIELTKTASLATILWSVINAATYSQNFLPHQFQILLRIPAALLCLPLLFYPLLFWGYYALNHKFLAVDAMLAIFQTNPSEAAAYLQSFHTALPFLFVSALLMLLAASVKLAAPLPTQQNLRNKIAFPLLLIIFILSIAKLPGTDRCVMIGILSSTKQELNSYKLYAQKAHERETKLSGLPIHLTQKEPGVYLLIIGESTTRNHMSLYGYPYDTTPHLASLAADPGALIFRNAYSNHTHTVPALSMALTERNQYNSIRAADAVSLIEIAKTAGYRTYWISNQARWGLYDTPITAIAVAADAQNFIYPASNSSYDGRLADFLPNLSEDTRALIVLHLMGCHSGYDDRYPPEYAIKTVTDPEVNDYDSAIHYNDLVLSRLNEASQKYKNFKGWIYFSDHGEDPDTHTSHESAQFTWPKARIPLIMQFTPDFISENPKIFETLAAHQNSYWTNDLLYNLMLTILGIEGAPNPEPHLDLASPAYDRTQENVLTLHGQKHISEEH